MKKIKQTFLKPFLLVCFGLMAVSIAFAYHREPPGSPGKPEVYYIWADGCKIMYKAPQRDGGAPILGYLIEYREVGSLEWIRANEYYVRDLKYAFDRGQYGQAIEFRVSAANEIGISRSSDVSDEIIFFD